MVVVKWYIYYINPETRMPVRINFLRREDAEMTGRLLDRAGIRDWVIKQFEE